MVMSRLGGVLVECRYHGVLRLFIDAILNVSLMRGGTRTGIRSLALSIHPQVLYYMYEEVGSSVCHSGTPYSYS